MDKLMYVAVFACFLAGSFGYVIFSFWVKPIMKYRSIKKQVVIDLTSYLNSLNDLDEEGAHLKEDERRIIDMRKHSTSLVECFQNILPSWYKLFLTTNGESPEEAGKHLLALTNTKEYEHAHNRVEKIRLALRI